MTSRTPSSIRHSSRTRGLAVLVMMAFLGSSLASYIHKAVERHARCPEHGEIIHVRGELAQAPESSPTSPASPSPGSHAQPASPEDSGHEHEHCYLCPNSHQRLGMVAADSTLGNTQPMLPRTATGVVAAPIHSDIYILAPKTSPPA